MKKSGCDSRESDRDRAETMLDPRAMDQNISVAAAWMRVAYAIRVPHVCRGGSCVSELNSEVREESSSAGA
jgi:hypothetical protein